jgi:phosphohistidine swiveling domain-containing protein
VIVPDVNRASVDLKRGRIYQISRAASHVDMRRGLTLIIIYCVMIYHDRMIVHDVNRVSVDLQRGRIYQISRAASHVDMRRALTQSSNNTLNEYLGRIIVIYILTCVYCTCQNRNHFVGT